MRICRVSVTYPSFGGGLKPGSGLVAYYPSLYMEFPTLYITLKSDAIRREIPKNVSFVEVEANNKPTPKKLQGNLYDGKKNSLIYRIMLMLRVLKTMRGIKFFLGSIYPLIRFKPDIVVCYDSISIFHMLFSKYILRCKCVMSFHSMTEVELMKKLFVLRYSVGKSDLIYSVTEKMTKRLEEFFPTEKLKVSPTGVDLSIFKNLGLVRKKQIIFVGPLNWKKGLKYLFEALSDIFDKTPDCKLIIVGDGPDRELLERHRENLNLREKIIFLGMQHQKDIVNYLNESMVFALPSIREGMPKAVHESLACGTPAVITDACTAPSIVEGAGVVVNAENPKQLANAISRLLNDNAFWMSCSSQAQKTARKYDWKKLSDQLLADYKKLFASEK